MEAGGATTCSWMGGGGGVADRCGCASLSGDAIGVVVCAVLKDVEILAYFLFAAEICPTYNLSRTRNSRTFENTDLTSRSIYSRISLLRFGVVYDAANM